MTLARKGTRRIIVEGIQFRWKVRHKPTYCQLMGWSPLTFVAESAERPGALLVASLPCARPDSALGSPKGSVLPRTVASGIKPALDRGWRPSRPGPAFTLSLDESQTSAAWRQPPSAPIAGGSVRSASTR